MQPALTDILRDMRLSGAIFLDAEFTEPWCIRAGVTPDDCRPVMEPPAALVAYHYVVEGSVTLELDGLRPVRFAEKHLILFPRNDPHRLGSTLDIEPVDVEALMEWPSEGGPARLRCGGGGQATRILCGFLGCDDPAHPLLSSLPPVLGIDVSKGEVGHWIEGSIRYAVRALAAGDNSTAERLAQLAEVLFSEAIREYVLALPVDDRGWFNGLRDPVLARAITLLHGQLSRHWTLAALAREVGSSRSSLSERFARYLGLSPMRYLAARRLARAAERLRSSEQPLALIAFEAGYQSEAGFSRAFRKYYGASPGAWRASRGAGSMAETG